MKKIDTLVDDIHDLMEYGKEPTPEFVDQFATELAKTVSNAMRSYMEDREGTLRMSNIGRPCHRQLWYEAHGEPGEEITPSVKLKFMFGHIIEEMLLYLAKEAGHSVSHEQEEVEVNGILGHMDAVIDGVVVDVKSASFYAFKKFQDGTLAQDDSFGYMAQISGYAHALGLPAAFLAMDKSSGNLCLMPVDRLENVEALSSKVKAVVAEPEPPRRGFDPVPDGKSGNLKLPMNCHYCAFKRSCYPGLRAFQYSNGLRYLAKVVLPPKVDEVPLD